MEYLKKVPVCQVNSHLPSEYSFICCASFENRCYTLPASIEADHVSSAYVIRNIDKAMKSENESNFRKICNEITSILPIEVHFDEPLSVMESLLETMRGLKETQVKNLVVDISTFTHETLLILLKILYINRNSFESIILVYNGASEYSPWLSKGCKEVRNVIGYSGIFNPAQKYHLVVLTGFELERATRLVELLEPDTLSIGTGIEPTNENHQKTMTTFKREFKDWLGNLQSVSHKQFEFSCSDIISTTSSLQEILTKSPKDNFIFVPLNTKLSTISLALVALSNPTVQVCYPIPEVYNMAYSKPSDNLSIIDLLKIGELSGFTNK